MANVGSLGFLMAAAILIGYYVGDFLDNYFGTSPIFLILFLVLGIIGGFMEYLNILKRTLNKNKQHERPVKKNDKTSGSPIER